MSEVLHFAEHRLQELALAFMALIYLTRVAWFLRFKAGRERQAPTGSGHGSSSKGILYSWAIVGMPWAMESSRTKRLLYAQFVVFHLGIAVAIGLSFVIPYGPDLLRIPGMIPVVQLVCGLACLVGVARIVRRFANLYIRAISSPDDFFSPILLTIWLLFATLTASLWPQTGWPRLAFFFTTAFFLVYVPFSKISHYLYYPFTRYYLAKTLTRRGVYPIPRNGYEVLP